MTLLFRACPRCQGTLEVSRESYGSEQRCLQCGFRKYLDYQPAPPPAPRGLSWRRGITNHDR